MFLNITGGNNETKDYLKDYYSIKPNLNLTINCRTKMFKHIQCIYNLIKQGSTLNKGSFKIQQ